MTDPLRTLVMRTRPPATCAPRRSRGGMVSMYEDGLRKALAGSRPSRKSCA